MPTKDRIRIKATPARNDNKSTAPIFDDADDTDWTPLYAAFQAAAEQVLDQAAHFPDAWPPEIAALRRVRTYLRRRALGVVACIAPDDLAYALALVFASRTGDLRPLEAAWRWLGPPAFAAYEADDNQRHAADRGHSSARRRAA